MDADHLLLNLPFDHFERYSITAEILSIVGVGRQSRLRILDVGGHSSSLKHFRPGDRVVLADPKQPPPYTHVREVPFLYDDYVRSVGGHLPFPDSSFDVVTAHDTIEHVPAGGRPAFLEDLIRVSSRFVIVNGPVAHPEVARAERRMADFWRGALGWDDHPLEEHLTHGLPRRELIADAFADRGMATIAIPNGNIRVWLAMMAVEGYLLSMPDPAGIQSAIERAFNLTLAPGDFGGVCYRTAFVAARRREDAEALRRVEDAFRGRVARSPAIDDPSSLDPVVQAL